MNVRSLPHFIARSRRTIYRRIPRFTRHLAPKARPFFNALHDLLDRHESLSLGRLLDEAGEQSWGLIILALSMFTFIPGVANILSIATLVVGFQMWWGYPHPWLPKSVQKITLHRGKIKDMLAKIEARLEWLAKRRGTRRAPSQKFTGFLITWTAFMAALPIPLPGANVLPAVALILFGVSLLEEWPSIGWLGFFLSLGNTLYFALSFDLALRAMHALFRGQAG